MQVDTILANGTHWQDYVLQIEYGGMQESLFKLYNLTGDPEHLRMATAFTREDFFSPTVQGIDTLNGRHANTMLAQVGSCLVARFRHPAVIHLLDSVARQPCEGYAFVGYQPSAAHAQVMGYVACYEVTGNQSCRLAVLNFVDMLVTSHSWPTGGSNAAEHWGEPMRMGTLLAEVCS